MFPVIVVPVEPVCQVFGKLSSGFVSFQIDSFVLQCPPESFDEDVVFEAPFTVHADPDIPGLEDGGECLAGKLASLGGVEYFRGPYLKRVSFSASTQNLVSKVLDSRQDSTFLVAQSMIAIRYMNPRAMGM